MPLPDAYAGPQTNSAFICDLFATKMSRQQVVGVLRDERRPGNGVREVARRATDLRLVIGSLKLTAGRSWSGWFREVLHRLLIWQFLAKRVISRTKKSCTAMVAAWFLRARWLRHLTGDVCDLADASSLRQALLGKSYQERDVCVSRCLSSTKRRVPLNAAPASELESNSNVSSIYGWTGRFISGWISFAESARL